MAVPIAFKDGCSKTAPALLETIVAVEVEMPEDKIGTVIGNLSARPGMIQSMDDIPGGVGKCIRTEVPLAEMFDYSNHATPTDARTRYLYDAVQALR